MSDRAALAVNWRTVLVVDALLGLAVAAVGVWLWTWWAPGVAVVVLGLVYVGLVVRRARRWAAVRRQAGL